MKKCTTRLRPVIVVVVVVVVVVTTWLSYIFPPACQQVLIYS